ncbi:MAG TPA: cytochrome c oxidase assembly protein [Bryobacteraceae bacterium]|nr:cytochrome c oxidase assembly protein [Bryobacteraceae bacterium]
MQSLASAALLSWTLDARGIVLLLLVALVYMRGWARMRRLLRDTRDFNRLYAFLAGLAVLFIATESPLDTFDSLFLSAHMAQHLLLMMVAPPLILRGDPVLPILRGLPRRFVKEGLGPFLTWMPLRRTGRFLTSPVFAWCTFAFSTLFWHFPKFYELALHSTTWHGVQHASFFWTGILFWWPIIQPGPGKPKWPSWIAVPYLLFADILNTALSAFFVFSGHLLYPTYEAVRASSLSAQDDQALAGLIMWVPGSLIYLVPAFVLAMRIFSSPAITAAPVRTARARRTGGPSLRLILPRLRRAAQVVMLLIAIAVMADGFYGPQVAALNLAGILPWIHWRALSILALLVVGNLFCMACPFMFVRDLGRKFLPARFRWPRPLRTKWMAAALIVLYLWAYEALELWNSPWLTAWIIAGYFLAALLIDGAFRGATFCKYVCPIGQFHFVSSLISPREVAVKRPEVCKSCGTYDCIRGNEHARGCELYLFQPKKAGNLDCTFCLDCVKACPHDNVSLVSILPAKALIADPYRSSIGKLSKRTDIVVLALLIVFGAFVNAAGMISPVVGWEHSTPANVALFVIMGAVVCPALLVLLSAVFNKLSGAGLNVRDFTRRSALALVPIGVAMWAAHLLFHLATSAAAAIPAIQRAATGAITAMAMPAAPGWLEPAQILLLDAGLLLTLYVSWRIASQYAGRIRATAALVAPWAALSFGLYAVGIWILFQPMQMRGMLH